MVCGILLIIKKSLLNSNFRHISSKIVLSQTLTLLLAVRAFWAAVGEGVNSYVGNTLVCFPFVQTTLKAVVYTKHFIKNVTAAPKNLRLRTYREHDTNLGMNCGGVTDMCMYMYDTNESNHHGWITHLKQYLEKSIDLEKKVMLFPKKADENAFKF